MEVGEEEKVGGGRGGEKRGNKERIRCSSV